MSDETENSEKAESLEKLRDMLFEMNRLTFEAVAIIDKQLLGLDPELEARVNEAIVQLRAKAAAKRKAGPNISGTEQGSRRRSTRSKKKPGAQ